MQRTLRFLAVASPLQVFGIIALISMVIIGWSAHNVYVTHSVTSAMQKQMFETASISEVEVFLLEQDVAEKDYILSGASQYLDDHQAAATMVAEELATATAAQATPLEEVAVEQLSSLNDAYQANFAQVVDAYNAGDAQGAATLSKEISDDKLSQVQTQLDDIIFEGETRLLQEVDTITQQVHKGIVVGVVGLVVFPVLAVWAFVTASRMTLPILTMINGIAAIAGGRFRPELLGTITERRDGLGMLARSIQKTALSLEAQEDEMEAEIEQLTERLRQSKRERLVMSLPGQRTINRISD